MEKNSKQLKEELEMLRIKERQECMKKIEGILKEHKCLLDPQFVFSGGRMVGKVAIVDL